jgi:Ser/Thr protein kinase RdoA (MazF antagonist)
MDICSSEILEEFATRYGINQKNLIKLHDALISEGGDTYVEKSLYEYNRLGIGYILRIVIPRYIDFAWLRGEMDWVNYLVENGIDAPRVIPSENGNLVEIFDDNETETSKHDTYAAVSFVKVPGRPIEFDNPNEWSAGLFEEYGQVIGNIHRLTKMYKPADADCRRLKWFQQDWFDNIDRFVPPSELPIRESLRELMECIHMLPRDGHSFGLIHGDAHPWNTLLNGSRIVFLDFDFCEYSWFASEIAIILFYAVMAPTEEMGKDEFAGYFLDSFLKGYYRENNLEEYWLETIPLFLRARMIAKYILAYSQWEAKTMSDNRQRSFSDWKNKIENDIPYLNIDFSAF